MYMSESLICPNCEMDVELNTKSRYAKIEGLVSMVAEIPTSKYSGRDIREKQEINRTKKHNVVFCKKCHRIVSITPIEEIDK